MENIPHNNGKPYPYLYTVTHRKVGPWNELMKELGIDTGQYYKRRKWSDKKIIKVIKDLQIEYGKVNSNYIYKNLRGLYDRIYTRFDNWKNLKNNLKKTIILRYKYQEFRVFLE